MKIHSIKNNSKIGWKLRRTTTRVVITTLLITALPLIGLFSVSYLKNSISQMNVISEQFDPTAEPECLRYDFLC